MLLYPKNIESKLGFDKIKQLLLEHCTSPLGKSLVTGLSPISESQKVAEILEETWEQKQQLESGDGFPELQGFILSNQIEHAGIEGYQLDSETLFQLKLNLDLTLTCLRSFSKNHELYPIWAARSAEVSVPLPLVKRLDEVFNTQGNIRDGASSELKRLRREISQSESKVRKNLESILGKARSDGYTEKESALTLRDGRLVLPLHAEHKRRIKGMVVDESATGKTVYLEPLEVFNLNNSIRELQFAEKRETNKILLGLTQLVAPSTGEIANCEDFLSLLDFTRAKAKMGIKLNSIKPKIEPGATLNLIGARHPLLQIAHQKQQLPVVPLTLKLDDQIKVVVISGPNAGGKSVCLKTVGLLQLMAQSGLLIPAHETSSLGCYDKIFVDIGDEQSIENDLSTYSSHLRNMNQFVRMADCNTLFLIDEFGSGTEPQFGGPIAQSILNFLVSRNAFGVVTTHYSNLKKFAEATPKVENAAMRFDLNKLEPLYELEIGRPGSSFALEIAAKTGLSAEILEEAKSHIGEDPVAFEQLVNQLEQSKQEHLVESAQLKELKQKLQKDLDTYEELLAQLNARKTTLINDAKEEAKDLLLQANKKIESTIRAIKESKADKSVTQTVRRDLERFQKQIKIDRPVSKAKEMVTGPIAVGDLVQIINSDAKGEVLKVSKTSAEVRLGGLKSKIKLNRLIKVGKVQEQTARPNKSPSTTLFQKRTHYSSDLEVRGMRGEAALKAVINFIDDGVMLGMKDLRIIHGKGDGILRQLIRNYLLEENTVSSFTDENGERGGDGVTLVTLK